MASAFAIYENALASASPSEGYADSLTLVKCNFVDSAAVTPCHCTTKPGTDCADSWENPGLSPEYAAVDVAGQWAGYAEACGWTGYEETEEWASYGCNTAQDGEWQGAEWPAADSSSTSQHGSSGDDGASGGAASPCVSPEYHATTNEAEQWAGYNAASGWAGYEGSEEWAGYSCAAQRGEWQAGEWPTADTDPTSQYGDLATNAEVADWSAYEEYVGYGSTSAEGGEWTAAWEDAGDYAGYGGEPSEQWQGDEPEAASAWEGELTEGAGHGEWDAGYGEWAAPETETDTSPEWPVYSDDPTVPSDATLDALLACAETEIATILCQL